MAYQVIARKWRPQKFSDMVGQDSLSRTLRNAIITDRTAHAYLFVGPRGIGKTTTARIFAKALNCEHPIDGEPCCQCDSCRAIAEERSVDVIEIDAATHTQVDKARELCEDVLTMPIHSRYKIYIIDEVHMLSTAAWNALLKTIEEPPAHAKFIFATTEVNKVLPTVISRCQRFDLKRIKTNDIAGRLRLICDAEKVKISDSALQIIARAADGGMRDAQSLLDQVISFFCTGSGDEITEAQTLSLFGLAASGDMERLMGAILTNDRSTAIKMIWQFAEAGKNLEILYEEIISWLRCVLLCGIVDTPSEILDEGPEKTALYTKLASLAKTPVVQRLLEQLSVNEYQLREALNKQVFMEAILLKAMRLAHAVQIEDLIARLTQLRNRGELNAVGSVVPLYEMPVGQILVRKAHGYNEDTEHPLIVAPNATHGATGQSPAGCPKGTDIVSGARGTECAKHTTIVPALATPAGTGLAHAGTEGAEAKTAGDESPAATEDAKGTESQRHEYSGGSASPAATELAHAGCPKGTTIAPALATPARTEGAEAKTAGDESLATTDEEVEEEEEVEEQPHAFVKTPVQIWDSLIIDVRDCLKMDFLAVAMEEGTPTGVSNGALTVVFDQDYELMQHTIVSKDVALLSRRLQEITGGAVWNLNLSVQAGFATPQQKEKRISTEKLRENMLHNKFLQQTIQQFSGRLTDAFTKDEAGSSAVNDKWK